MPTLNQAIDLTSCAAAVNGALAHRRPAFVATSGEDGTPDIGPISGFRPSYTTVAGQAVLGALAALGVSNARAVAPVASVPDLGGAPAT